MLKLKVNGVEVTVYTRDEYAKVIEEDSMCPDDDALYSEPFDHNSVDEDLEDVYPELKGTKYIMVPENFENPYEAVIYENGTVWIYGAGFDSEINTANTLSNTTISNAIIALKMLVAGEDRELNNDDAKRFNADFDFVEVK